MSEGPFTDNSPMPPVPVESVPWDRVETFFGQLSHDLRNGLNACELQLTFLGEISTDPDAVEDIKRLRVSLAGITRQLQNARISMGGATGHLMDYPARDLMEDLQERFERADPEVAARLQWALEVPAAKLVNVDPELVLSSCLEILKNAIHFADKDAVITCSTRAEGNGGDVLVCVEHPLEKPPVVPVEEWGRSPLISTRRGAYGLGLFRARRALVASGCELEFAWSAERKILTSMVRLPAAAATPQA